MSNNVPGGGMSSLYTIPTTPTTPGTTNYQQLAAGLGIAGAISTVAAGYTQKLNYQMKSRTQAQAAKQARTDAKASALRMAQNYNDMAANQAVMMAAQGRSFSSGSIQNMRKVDQERLQWDLDYNKAAGEIGASTMYADAKGFELAASTAMTGSITKGILQAGQTYIDYKRIQ